MIDKIKKVSKILNFLFPFHSSKIYRWGIFFNGDWIGVYYGEDLSRLNIELWMKEFPGDCNPIMLVEMFEFF